MTLISFRRAAALLFVCAVCCSAVLAQGTRPLVTGLPDFTELIDQVGPAVVNIHTTDKLAPRRSARGKHGRRAPRAEDEEQGGGVGSGFLISADGFVLTNAHVVEGADEVIVTMTDRREFKARVLGSDKRTDVALLKVEASGLPQLAMGDSGKIRVGEWVIAIGSPFNLDSTVTAGIISAKARDTGDYLPLIQSDVAVNPGNSGGPLINLRGEVIGINSQIATMSGGYNGISFAVPIDEAMRVAQQLREAGRVRRGRLGVQIGDLSREVADTLGLGQPRGVEVALVEARGPAAVSGIRPGDVILKFNGQGVDKTTDLIRLVGASSIGTAAQVTLWRKGALQDVQVQVAEMPEPKAPRALASPGAPAKAASALGLRVAPLPPARRKAMKLDGGVLVADADGPARRAGLRAGDLILQLNKVDVDSAPAFNRLAASLDPALPVALLVRRGASTQYMVIRARQ